MSSGVRKTAANANHSIERISQHNEFFNFGSWEEIDKAVILRGVHSLAWNEPFPTSSPNFGRLPS